MPRIKKQYTIRSSKPLRSKTIPKKHQKQQQSAYIPTAEPQSQQWRAQSLQNRASVLVQQAHDEFIQQSEDSLIITIYNKLHGLVYNRCGIGSNEEFIAWFSKWDGFYNAEFYQRIEEKCGIKLSIRNMRSIYHSTDSSLAQSQQSEPTKLVDIAVSLNGTGKVCTVNIDNEPAKFDFAELITENNRRKKLWEDSEDAFAKYCVDQCRINLPNLPYKYLGIPQVITICGPDGTTCFKDEIKFFESEDNIHYQHLNQLQTFRLQNKMNQLIAHGKAVISMNEDGMLIAIHKVPEKTKGEYFDYSDFYSQYDDEVTPELQKFYEKLLNRLEPLPEVFMYQTLELKNQLFYWFDDASPSWEDVVSRLKDDIHKQSLLDAVSQALPGIQATNVSCEYRLRMPENCISCPSEPSKCLELSFKIINQHGEFAKTIIQKQKKLHRLKKKALKAFVAKIVDYVLRITERYVNIEAKEALVERFSYGKILPSMKITIDNYGILLESIDDAQFIDDIKKGVKQQSTGFITVKRTENKKWEYRLNAQR